MTGEPKTEVRNTKQRQAVRAALRAQTDFVTTQQLHGRLQDDGQKVSLATTYRVLQSMAESGEVDTLRNDDGEAIYRRCVATHHHHHLVCRNCGATVELEAPTVEAWAEQTASAYGYTDLAHTVEIVGLCPQCRT
ncbi:MAG: transcriptional repressor [Kocuria sp.]|nr:transcriptional repressor [Kocuria sp.]